MVDENIRKEFETLKSDVNKLRQDLHDLTNALRNAGADRIAETKQSLRHLAPAYS